MPQQKSLQPIFEIQDLQGGKRPEKTPKKSTGPVVGAIIVVVTLSFGALYFWGGYLNRHISSTAVAVQSQ